jgi:hypothetical protein
MDVVCKSCSASYHIPQRLPDEGSRQFRCAVCGESFTRRPAPVLEAASVRIGFRAAAGEAKSKRRGVLRIRLGVAARRLGGAALGVGLAASAMAAIAAREAIVRSAPATARIYAAIGLPVNLRGVAIESLRATTSEDGGKTVLMVAGEIVNLRAIETAVADLRITLRGDDGRELYVWTTRGAKDRLAAHERAPFRARLASPPEGVRDVLVKFSASEDKASFTEAGS